MYMSASGRTCVLANPRIKAGCLPPYRLGFTLIELLMVIGIVALLIALAAPAYARWKERGMVLRQQVANRQNAAMIFMYTGDWKDTYPIADPLVVVNRWTWWKPMEAVGLFRDGGEVDPIWYRDFGRVDDLLSMALMRNPEEMVRGRTVPVEQAVSRAVQLHEVAFPCQKGMTVYSCRYPDNVTTYFGSHDVVMATPCPISMCDESAVFAAMRDFRIDRPFHTENSTGIPIVSTWEGFRGRDR